MSRARSGGPSLGRRLALQRCLSGAAGAAALCCRGSAAVAEDLLPPGPRSPEADAEGFVPQPALHWKPLPGDRVECGLCPRRCRVADRERGACGCRENIGGRYFTLVHSRAVAAHLDPIEKKPFFHVLPGSGAFSVATAGCNLECRFCQNWRISQFRPEQVEAEHLPPARAVALARRLGARSVAYTYSEPTVFFEYMLDMARAARRAGLRNLLVSSGYLNPEPLAELLTQLDAVKIDLKAFRPEFYREQCRGELAPVLETLRAVRRCGVWLEVVVLLIPSLNDGDEELRAMSRWLVAELGPDLPLHFSRFHPSYRLQTLPPTPLSRLQRARAIALEEGLRYVYLGNVPGDPAEHTRCPHCDTLLLERRGNRLLSQHLVAGACPHCQRSIPGVWN